MPLHKAKSRLTHRSLAYRSLNLLGKLYNTLSGKEQIPKTLLKRAIANGLQKSEIEIAFQQIKSRDELSKLLFSVAKDRLNKAYYWLELGLKNRACENYFQSSLWGLYAYLSTNDRQEQEEISLHYKQCYQSATAYFTHPTELIEFPYLNTSGQGYLRLPNPDKEYLDFEPSHNYPCVILFNGLASTKEELYFTENSLLSLGIATFSFDYPLINDNKLDTLFSLNINELFNAIYLYLNNRNEINPNRIGLYGISIGGNIALSIASQFPKRFKAVASLSAPYDFLPDLDMLMPVLHHEFAFRTTSSQAHLFDIGRQTSLPIEVHKIESPLLVASGGKDVIAPAQDNRLIYDRASSSDKKLLLCPNAGHYLFEMMPSLRYEIAQWVRARL